jgi:hypothetical protein
MTIPSERTRAVIATRGFLEQMSVGRMRAVPPETLMKQALALLRHYPSNMDMHLTSSALPSWWAPPTNLREDQSFTPPQVRAVPESPSRRRRKGD